MVLVNSLLAQVTITAQRLSSLVDHPDKEAWVFVYNEVGRGNSRISKKLYFKKNGLEFINFFKWMNDVA